MPLPGWLFQPHGRSRRVTRNLVPLCLRVSWPLFCRIMGHHDSLWPMIGSDLTEMEEDSLFGQDTLVVEGPPAWFDEHTVQDRYATIVMVETLPTVRLPRLSYDLTFK